MTTANLPGNLPVGLGTANVRHISVWRGTGEDEAFGPEHEGFVRLWAAGGPGGAAGEFYRVPHVDRIPPFLMTLSNDADLWMYVSSAGGLTAGRVRPAGAVFPYETEDRLHRLYGITGPITLLRIRHGDGSQSLWEPFSPFVNDPLVERHLYRSPLGSQVIFEALHRGLGLTFRYRWAAADGLGIVRSAWLISRRDSDVTVDVLDGLLNLMPAGVPVSMQQAYSCLTDAYKQADRVGGTTLAVYSLTSPIGDKPEPGEVLHATTAWSHGLGGASLLLTEDAVESFRLGREAEGESPGVRNEGRRGAYLLRSTLQLAAGDSIGWHQVIDAEQDHGHVARTRELLARPAELWSQIERALAATDEGLRRNIAACDGLQVGRDRSVSAHHGLNVLFNNMRGGVPLEHYTVSASDFGAFVGARNRAVRTEYAGFLSEGLPGSLPTSELLERAAATGSADLLRLALEYVPLTFSRRHGDPSRPWNQFAIHLRNRDGTRRAGYQGNWRDIFQNWEALALSYPRLLPQFIGKFLSASTSDGFNPYRVTSDGIEWEVEDPNEPWSHLGYWGDHQIVYLLRLLQLSHDMQPGWLVEMLGRAVFAFADVPYRLAAYEEICRNPKRSIQFDAARDREIRGRVERMGADGKLLPAGGEAGVAHATLLEKLLIPLLSKLCNIVPGGGVWLNTQRPEWNDANNALAGWGLSVVTLGYLRSYIAFMRDLLERAGVEQKACSVSIEVGEWMQAVGDALAGDAPAVHGGSEPEAARAILDRLGLAFEAYRTRTYGHGFSGHAEIDLAKVRAMLDRAHGFVTHALAANRRSDGLFHAYNLLSLPAARSLEVSRLSEMLEGQVSALSSGLLSTQEAAELIDSLFESPLYRADIRSFILYPHRTLPDFLERNRIPARMVTGCPLLRRLVEEGDARIVVMDAAGDYRFAAGLTSAHELSAALDQVSRGPLGDLVTSCRQQVLDAYEHVFQHHRFTGRSGSMHAYEGLGSVYWHMVGKLLVATQECYWQEATGAGRSDLLGRLARSYYRVRDGLGFTKTARAYGAVPIEPYSHTPWGGGARQPGMTGQVKEELLTRRGELGVRVSAGRLSFDPRLLRRRELLDRPGVFHALTPGGTEAELQIPAGSVAFTVCQLPVVYTFGPAPFSMHLHHVGGGVTRQLAPTLDLATSQSVFDRDHRFTRLELHWPASVLTIE